MLQQWRDRNSAPMSEILMGMAKHSQGNEATCFGCEKPGHLRKDCKNPLGNMKGLLPCPHCGKQKHWRNECKSKFHKDGTPPTKEAGETSETKS